MHGHYDRQDFDPALSYAQRWLALDPLPESAHRRLMQLYAQNGDRSAALRQYQTCRRLLEEELSAPPEAETTALYQRLQQEAGRHRKIIAESFAIIDGDTEAGLKNNLLGYGGMGNVYRGLHLKSGEPVAIKVLKPEIVAGNPDLVERLCGRAKRCASADKTARVWPSVEALLNEAKILIQRGPPEFTPEERMRFGLGRK